MTNAGAAGVCEAALGTLGISREDLRCGFLCDSMSKSCLPILARPGILPRLTRTLDKQRGYVNGAIAVVCESLRGNAVFVAKLVASGDYVLVHPMVEDGGSFLAMLLRVCYDHSEGAGKFIDSWVYLF